MGRSRAAPTDTASEKEQHHTDICNTIEQWVLEPVSGSWSIFYQIQIPVQLRNKNSCFKMKTHFHDIFTVQQTKNFILPIYYIDTGKDKKKNTGTLK